MARPHPIVIDLCAVIVAATEQTPSILVVRGAGGQPDGLPSGPFHAETHRTLAKGLQQWVEEQTGLVLSYAEQLYTFGDKFRDPGELEGGPRHVSVGYVALTRGAALAGGGQAAWVDWYAYFPWEDWRRGKPALVDTVIVPRFDRWIEKSTDADEREQRRERVATTFGLTGAGWDFVRVLERYELLYQTGSVIEAMRDRDARIAAGVSRRPKFDDSASDVAQALGRPMTRDHRRILATAMSRIRGKLTYRPVAFDLLPESFTLFQLQQTVEALSGTRLHKQNFRRMVINGKLVEPTGRTDQGGAGRPAALYRFRPDVLGEQLAPGVGKFGRR